MIDQAFIDLFTNLESREGLFLWMAMLVSFFMGFIIAYLLRSAKVRRLKKELKAAKEKEQLLVAEKAGTMAELEKRNKELEEESRERVALMDRVAALEQEKSKYTAETESLNYSIQTLQDTNAKYIDSIDDLHHQIQALTIENQDLARTSTGANAAVNTDDLVSKAEYRSLQTRLTAFENSLNQMSAENKQLRTDLSALSSGATVATHSTSNETTADAPEPELKVNADKTVLYKKIVTDDRHKDDLTEIDGIGDFVAKKLNDIGVFTYEDIAAWDEQRIDEITSAIAYLPGRIQKDDWPGQAQALIAKYGSDHGQKMALKAVQADDLKLIEGIGPKITELLKEGGIGTFAQLAASDPADLKSILEAAGPAFAMHSPYTWPIQARLAVKGQWDELEQYQDELKGGREE